MPALSTLPTHILFRDLEALVTTHRACTANIVRHLAEVDARRAYAEHGHSSLFGYCMAELRFSEDEACRRVEAARLLQKYPVIGLALDSGAVSLSVLGALKAHLTQANHEKLLAGVSGMSRRKAEEWLAGRFPRPDVRESVRLLPLPRVASLDSNDSCESRLKPQAEAVEQVLLAAPPTRAAGTLEPRSAERFALHCTMDREVKEQLELARDLMRHQNASGSLDAVIAAAIAALVERLKIKKLGATRNRAERPRRSTRAPVDTAPSVGEHCPVQTDSTLPNAPEVPSHASRRSHIPNAVRRAVIARDGIGCSHVGPDGQRCSSCAFLEFDHLKPVGIGGTDDVSNLRLRCQAHNQLEAERVYGRAFMKRARAKPRRGTTSEHRH
jgi:5-methylcytosine-specific restriction endonuclease McrA